MMQFENLRVSSRNRLINESHVNQESKNLEIWTAFRSKSRRKKILWNVSKEADEYELYSAYFTLFYRYKIQILLNVS